MAERRNGNYSSCCRLCLSESQGMLKNIFGDNALPQKLRDLLAVDVNSSDKLSTMICDHCTGKLKNWEVFKAQCSKNQIKLMQRLNSWTTQSFAEMSIQIKDEVIDDRDAEILIIDDDLPIIKTEPVDNDAVPQRQEESPPPPLTPNPPDLNYINGDQEEDQMLVNSGKVRIEETEPDDGRQCHVCDKIFSTSGNRKKHQKMMHKDMFSARIPIIKAKILKTYQVKRKINPLQLTGQEVSSLQALLTSTPKSVVTTPQRTESTSITDLATSTPVSQQAEIQKIQFAAGLKLQQRSQTQTESVPFTSLEKSYIKKCKYMSTMLESLVCICHHERFETSKGLLTHIRKPALWYPIFTCYNCMITFSDRSSFMKHFFNCPRPPFENIKRLSELTANADAKCRLYQNYKCLKCNWTFTFHEDFSAHLDLEHMEVKDVPPYKCLCLTEFETFDQYKNHLCITCFLRYYCDICHQMFKDVDAFKEHCVNDHDQEENILPGIEEYQEFDEAVVERAKKANRKRAASRSLSLPRKRACTSTRSFNNEDPPTLERAETSGGGNEIIIATLKKETNNQGTTCPICKKSYASYYSMLRHLKSHDVANPTDKSKSPIQSNQPRFSCPDCKHLFESLQEWTAHRETHALKTCEECGKQFAFQAELDQHRSVHLNIKVYRDSKTQDYKSAIISNILCCEICSKTFSSKSELRQHNLLHEKMPVLSAHDAEDNDKKTIEIKEKLPGKYSCLPCGKSYTGYGGLWEHNRRFHSGKPIGKEYPRKCDECDRVFTTGASYTNHKKYHARTNNSAQTNDPGSSKSTKVINPAQVKVKKDIAADSEESYFNCNKCFKVFSTRCNLRNHMKSHGMGTNSRTTKGGKVSKTYWCNICHQACPGYSELQDHKQEHRNEETPKLHNPNEQKPTVYECNICSKGFTTNFALKQHVIKHNAAKRQLVYCKHCKMAFQSEALLNVHMDKEHDEARKPTAAQDEPFQHKHACNLCRKSFANPVALVAHKGWHKRGKMEKQKKTQEKEFRKMVNQIPKTDATPAPTAAAILLSSLQKYKCTKCNKQFVSDTSLQIHILEVHRNVNATVVGFQCRSCKISFDSQAGYDKHMQLHDVVEKQAEKIEAKAKISPTKPFPCKYCPSGFSRKDTLNNHIRFHHRDELAQSFPCTHCDRVFEKQEALNVHVRIHSQHPVNQKSKYSYSCSICHMGFDVPKHLRDHVIAVHPF